MCDIIAKNVYYFFKYSPDPYRDYKQGTEDFWRYKIGQGSTNKKKLNTLGRRVWGVSKFQAENI